MVTGGAGFIGSNFVRYMLKKYPDYRVTVLDKLTYAGNRENLADLENNNNYKFVVGDICDEKIVAGVAEGADVIVNFAAETHVDRSILTPDSFIKTDVLGTYVLAESARKYNHKRYVQISTDEVYGSIIDGSFKEEDKFKPNSPYSASKAGADLFIQAYIKTYNFPAVIVRPSNNYGPFQYPEKMIPLFITNAMEDIQLPMYGDGLYVRDWLYVLDNCEAIDTVLHKGKSGQAYNIGGGNEITNIELTKRILQLLGKPETLIKYVKDRPGHDRRYSLDCTKISTELGWKPKFSFSEALKSTVEWYVDNKQWWQRIKKKQTEFIEFYKKQYKS